MNSLVLFALLAVTTQVQGHPLSTPPHVRKIVSEVDGAPEQINNGGRIINGTEAQRGQFPYQAALFLDLNGFCGGSLISPRWVLTAAHCADGIKLFTVILGAQALSSGAESGRITKLTNKKIVHSGYSSAIPRNDIALIDLIREVPLSLFVQVVPLATGSNQYVNAIARTSGWGRISDANDTTSNQLNYVDMKVISNEECVKSYNSLMIRPNVLCTIGEDNKGTCNGDSGGPLVAHATGKQIGITSFGSKEGCTRAPSAFVRVTSHTEWIKAYTGINI